MTISQSISVPTLNNNRKLYLVPSIDKEFGKEWTHPNFSPTPSARADLPNLYEWSESFIISVIEIWSGRRGTIQLSKNCHRSVINKIIKQGSQLNHPCQIRKIYLSQPIEGVLEVTATLRIKDRVRSLTLRFEGVDKKWVCTELNLL